MMVVLVASATAVLEEWAMTIESGMVICTPACEPSLYKF